MLQHSTRRRRPGDGPRGTPVAERDYSLDRMLDQLEAFYERLSQMRTAPR
jgi:hypothetical protein